MDVLIILIKLEAWLSVLWWQVFSKLSKLIDSVLWGTAVSVMCALITSSDYNATDRLNSSSQQCFAITRYGEALQSLDWQTKYLVFFPKGRIRCTIHFLNTTIFRLQLMISFPYHIFIEGTGCFQKSHDHCRAVLIGFLLTNCVSRYFIS